MRGSWRRYHCVIVPVLLLAGCGYSASPNAASQASSTAHAVSAHHSPDTRRAASPQASKPPATPGTTPLLRGCLNPEAPVNLATPVAITVRGLSNAGAGSSITVSYSENTSWSLFNLVLWDLNAPGNDTYPLQYWTVNPVTLQNVASYSFAVPMALQGSAVRILIQFLGLHGQVETEYSPRFEIH